MSTDYQVTQGAPLATVSSRFLAMLVDGLILLVPGALLHVGLPFAGPLFLGFFYFPIFHASPLQATLGKKAFRLKVTDARGETLTLQMAFLRYGVALASSCMFFAGHFVAYFTAKRQALHDLVADSVVIDGVNETVKPLEAWIQTLRRLFGADQPSIGPVFRSGEPPKNTQDEIRRRLDELERLYELRRKGVISEDEYQKMRKDLV